MNLLDNTFGSGRIIDFILCMIVVELFVLGTYWHRTKRGVEPKSLIAMLGAGACLMMTIKAVLAQAGVEQIAFWLAGSLVFHLADLCCRWNHGAISGAKSSGNKSSGTGSKP